jgi:hypothetical protein
MVTEVGHDYCFLKWNPPPVNSLSDERERITGYVIEKKGTNRRVWQVNINLIVKLEIICNFKYFTIKLCFKFNYIFVKLENKSFTTCKKINYVFC